MKKANRQAAAQQAPPQVVALALPADDVALGGPTDFCNWVLPGRLLMGAFPKRTTLLHQILQAGITTFVSLVHPRELERLEKYGPYFDFAKKMVQENKEGLLTQKVSDLQFVHLPITDKDIAGDDDILHLIEDMERRMLGGERIFIHCRGGHGRTGTVIAVLLAKLFNLDAYEALEKTQQYHDHREDVKQKPGVYSCPETALQTNQVYRLVGKFSL